MRRRRRDARRRLGVEVKGLGRDDRKGKEEEEEEGRGGLTAMLIRRVSGIIQFLCLIA